ncbi:GlxA family transcriptional regulator [Fulvimonas soli]|jgi:transcriptional regulator GlxA family with amidase domain|uniref:AraC family transcriptional regulator with amidase-like domain n=1 Tax=Fulvimonas soli TaxID=155197 RepID=A0A316IG38_9GAMM|nr:helix-turn-helix domain-containing protein [Fulvimonas soli]PWK92482.1 AraC family transcriptional regulator with amidase-like domain [Fulvimonas soli]TNY27153.1 AraC family transcriptional regulator [Fulvimonas soli]
MAMTRVAVVAFDRIRPFHLSVPCAVFDEPAGAPAPPFELRVCAAAPGELRTRAGFGIAARHGLRALAWADIVVVPSWRDPDETPPRPLLAALRRAHARGALVVGLCVGAYVLAEAGLLDDRRATTHWRWAEHFARRYPRVRVDPGVLYVDEGDVLTSAGTAAGIDCCLHVVRRCLGAEAASRIARMLVVPPHRQGGQAQYIEQPVLAAARDTPLTRTLDWAARHLDAAHSLDSLAARAAMSRRSFTRHFRRHTGTTVGRWLLGQRLALAQRLLETTGLPVARIAERAGFGTPLSLRQHFATAFGTTPASYRREFRGR